MGSGASKTAAQSTIRKFPNRSPGSTMPPPSSPTSSPSASAAAAAVEQVQARIRAAKRPAAAAFNFDQSAASSQPDTRSRHASPTAGLTKDEALRADAHHHHDPQHQDPTMIPPDLAQRLRTIGVVQPNPTYSHSSTAWNTPSPGSGGRGGGGASPSGPVFPAASQNAVLSALDARQRVQEEADREFEGLGLASSEGRRFMHAGMIRDVLVMRERGASEAAIEDRFNLKKGVVRTLGPPELYRPCVEGQSVPG